MVIRRSPSPIKDGQEQDVTKLAKRIGVFCGSSNAAPLNYVKASQMLGEELARRECILIYGGGEHGLMGAVARGAHATGKACIVSVLPDFMQSTSGHSYGELILVPSMAARKATINDLSDAFIALPGGFGTLDELTEMLTWNQIGYNNKLVGILNTDGFYDSWLAWIERATKDAFISQQHLQNLIVRDTPTLLLDALLATTPVIVPGKFRTQA